MKIDLKNILICVLMILSIYFGYSWVMSKTDSKITVEKLQDEYVRLFLKKKSNDDSIIKIQNEFSKLKQIESELRIENLRLLRDLQIAEKNANLSKSGLDKLKKDLDESRSKIDYMIKNPTYKTDEHLLESIRKIEKNK